MLTALSDILRFFLMPCYELTGNWWIAILLFTLLTKIILMPISLWCQKNALSMVQLMPELNRIKVQYYGDNETIGEMQTKLYKEKHYHPLISLIPLAIQIIILFGLVDVIHSITDSGEAGTELIGIVPIATGGIAWVWPLLAGASAVMLCYAQNRINPLQREQTRAEQNMTNAVSILIALLLGVFVAAGMAFYWICSNISSIAVQLACNAIMKPSKYIDYEDLKESKKELQELDQLESDRTRKWYQKDPLAKREKADYKRFLNVSDKHLVFYSEGSGFYKYFEGTIRYLLANSNGVIHYITNDPNDQVFNLASSMPRLVPYYIGQKKAITLMMKMDASVVVMTLHDLDTYYIKRSYIRKDIEYIFMFHHMTSIHMVTTKTAHAHYDTIMCVGPHQVKELRRSEELYGYKRRKLIEAGYSLLDEEISAYNQMLQNQVIAPEDSKPTILIAPSWQKDNILDTCIDDLLNGMLGHDWRIIVRPHPEYTKRYRVRWEALQERYAHISSDTLYFEQDFSSNETIWLSDVLVTDWSSVAVEFSFATLKPSLFVNTPMKVHNEDWEELGITPTDISLRDEIGVSVAQDSAVGAGDLVAQLLSSQEEWRERISQLRDGFVYNIGSSARVSGEYILEAVLKSQEEGEAEVRS